MVAMTAAAPESASKCLSQELARRLRSRASRRKDKLHPCVSLLLGAVATVSTVLLTTMALVNIHAATESGAISPTFLELVILPLATTTIENTIAVLHARRQEMDWTIQATLVSGIGILMFVMPLTICIGWAMGEESMTLHFNGF